MRRLSKEERAISDKRTQERENLRRRLLRKTNPELVRERERKYWSSPRGKEVLSAWFKTPKGAAHLRRGTLGRYGITSKEYEALFLQQEGVCKLCFKAETSKYKTGLVTRLTVDHCHRTGKVRGLLCRKCNAALGLLDDDVKILQQAIEYLK